LESVTAAPAEQAAARRNERELDRFPYGREGSAGDRVGIKASPGVSLAIPLSQKKLLANPSHNHEIKTHFAYQFKTGH